MTHKLKKFKGSLMAEALKKAEGKEYKDNYGKAPKLALVDEKKKKSKY